MFHLFFLFFFSFSTLLPEANPWNLPLTIRILNRKHISHFTIGTRKEGYAVYFILNDRFPYNYKSTSYAFYMIFTDAKKSMDFSHDLDNHFQKGLDIKIQLRGSEIVKCEFL